VDTAGLFLVAATSQVRPGGRIVLIQPQSILAARDAVYALDEPALEAAVRGYTDVSRTSRLLAAAMQQLRNPIRRFSWTEKALMLWEAAVALPLAARLYYRRALPKQLMARGRRRIR
jgi:hypothetical protein